MRGTRLLAPLLALAVCACRAAPDGSPFLSETAVALDLPLVRQDELYGCGLAAVSALCQYWDVELPRDARAELARRASDEKGLSGNELREALDARGLETYLFPGTLDRGDTGIYRHIDLGRPLVVMVSPDGRAHHYCLVYGYDTARGNLILLDPARGEVLRPIRTFEREWEACRRFTLLACSKNGDRKLPMGAGPAYGGGAPPEEK